MTILVSIFVWRIWVKHVGLFVMPRRNVIKLGNENVHTTRVERSCKYCT